MEQQATYMEGLLLSVNDYPDKVKNYLLMAFEKIRAYNNIDHDFANHLKELTLKTEKGDGVMHDVDDYDSVVHDLPPGSTIIYFKEAGLFRIYTDEEFGRTFANYARNDCRKPKKREVYEVVENNRPQRIFMLIDTRDPEELEKMKHYITDFLEMKNMSDDITIYDDGKSYEIIVNHVVQNISERHAFIDELTHYIDNKADDPESTKMIARNHKSDFVRATMTLPPDLKELISGPMLRYITQGILPTQINVNIGNLTNIHAHTINTNTITGDISLDETVDPFIEHLENNCEWYEPDSVIPYNKLYREYLQIGNITKCKFSLKYQNILYEKADRVQTKGRRVQMIRLI